MAVDFGFEVQIDQLARDDGAAVHKTAAIYDLAGPQDPAHLPVNPPGQWNQFEIRVHAQTYDVSLNGTPVTHYVNPDPPRAVLDAWGTELHRPPNAHRPNRLPAHPAEGPLKPAPDSCDARNRRCRSGHHHSPLTRSPSTQRRWAPSR